MSSLKSLVLKEDRAAQATESLLLMPSTGTVLEQEEPRSEVGCAGLKYRLQERACDLFL